MGPTPTARTQALRTNRTSQSWWVKSKRVEAGADRTGRRCGRGCVRERAFGAASRRSVLRSPGDGWTGQFGRKVLCMCCAHPEELPAEVLDDVASVVGAEVTLLSRLPGGVNGGAMRVQLAGRANAVLKAVPRAHPNHLDETLRAQRVVEHMRRRGYPTPAWLGVGATATHVWHLMDFVDAAPAPELTPSLVEQLMEIIELQAGQASEPYDHWSYAWRVATGQESAVAGLDFNETPEQSLLRQSVARLSGYSSVVSALVERLRLVCADVPPPREAPDMVHADLSTPSNVLVRDGAVVAVVDIGNAGSGTRATDLTTLVWYTFQDPLLDDVRRRLWTRILDLVGWEGAAVLAATQILHMLEIPIRHGRHDVVPGVVKRGHRALDELNALR